MIQPNRELNNVLRPQAFDDFVGNPAVKRALTMFSRAARERHEPMGHCLLTGPAGCGKTTLAGIIAHEAGVKLITLNGATIESAENLVDAILGLKANDVLLVDEIHRLGPALCECFFTAMEDSYLDCVYQGRNAHVTLPPFTLLAATTMPGRLPKPMLTRFEISQRLDFYSTDELAEIVYRSCAKLGITATPDAITAIAARARGTPRIANVLLKRCRDYAQVEGNGRIAVTSADVFGCCAMLGVSETGLDTLDRAMLRVLVDSKKPVGIKALAASLQEDLVTLEEGHEPYLLASGYIQRQSNGRIATDKARQLFTEPNP